MSKAPAKPKAKKSKWMPVLLLVFIIGIVTMQHAFLFVFIALLPSIVAYIVDRNPNYSVFFTVACLNVSGLLPFLLEIVFSPKLIEAASARMGDVYTWLVIYSAAAVGWALVILCPTVCKLVLQGMRRGQIMHLENQQRKLIEEWGPEIRRKD